MFGDHLPFLGDRFLVYTQSGLIKSPDQKEWSHAEREAMHAVPVVMWTNLPRKVSLPKIISPIFLGSIVKRASGLDENKLDKLLNRIQNINPIISQFYSKTINGTVAEGPPQTGELFSLYEMIEYDQLFGRKYATQLISRVKTTQ